MILRPMMKTIFSDISINLTLILVMTMDYLH